jgi:hypothetical protein
VPKRRRDRRPLRIAYADPPYFGFAKEFYGRHHREAGVYDTIDGHARLVDRLCGEFPDGWALSLHSPSLRHILPLCPADCRVGAWVKPFASFKPGVAVAFAWEPVIFRGGRPRPRTEPTIRDWVACNVTLRAGLAGAKPPGFCLWLFAVLGLEPGDEFVDLFPGTRAVSRAWRRFRRGESWPTSACSQSGSGAVSRANTSRAGRLSRRRAAR